MHLTRDSGKQEPSKGSESISGLLSRSRAAGPSSSTHREVDIAQRGHDARDGADNEGAIRGQHHLGAGAHGHAAGQRGVLDVHLQGQPLCLGISGTLLLLRDGANGKAGESALKMFPEEISGPIFLLGGEKQEKNRQILSVAQVHRDSHSPYHTRSLHLQIWVGSCDEMEIVSPVCHASSAVTETCHPHIQHVQVSSPIAHELLRRPCLMGSAAKNGSAMCPKASPVPAVTWVHHRPGITPHLKPCRTHSHFLIQYSLRVSAWMLVSPSSPETLGLFSKTQVPVVS